MNQNSFHNENFPNRSTPFASRCVVWVPIPQILMLLCYGFSQIFSQ